MIKFSVVHRAKDGLALSASTDVESGIELRDSKRYTKLLARKARHFPVRSKMTVGKYRIFFTTEADVCFLLICELTYTDVLAYSFLDELKNEFLERYARSSVDKVVRPYAFIDFDEHIQKTKQKYNNIRTLYTRVDLSRITDELKADPSYEVTDRDLGLSKPIVSNGTLLSVPPSSTVILKDQLAPLTVTETISLLLTALCAILNMIRLVPFASSHLPDVEPSEGGWVLMCFCLFSSAVVNSLQCYTLLYRSRHRHVMNISCFVLNVLLVYYLQELRNTVQIVFHLVVTLFVSVCIWKRSVVGKSTDQNV